jgi:hypothetical protein
MPAGWAETFQSMDRRVFRDLNARACPELLRGGFSGMNDIYWSKSVSILLGHRMNSKHPQWTDSRLKQVAFVALQRKV